MAVTGVVEVEAASAALVVEVLVAVVLAVDGSLFYSNDFNKVPSTRDLIV